MIKKPDWSKAPEWAKSTAMDSDGRWCWYSEDSPELGVKFWLTDEYVETVPDQDFVEVYGDDWRDTLEKRP